MRIRMVIGISGGRHDGRPWPPPGHEIDVQDHEGQDLIRAHHAVYVGPSEPPPVPPPVERIISEPSSTGAGPAPEVTNVVVHPSGPPDAETPQAEELPVPRPSDPKQSWVDYAISQGATEDQAASMTKNDLMSRYGGRL